MANLYDDEDQLPGPPAPNPPPVAPGQIGPVGPVAGVPPQGPEAPAGQVGGGGGGTPAAPWALPALPGLNIPGAPQFRAPVYTAPTKESVFQDPGYQFRVDQGNRALERSAAAKGMLRGGNTLTDLSQWNQNLASQEYQNVVNRAQQEYQNKYRSAYDAFAPEMARYQILAGGMRDLARDRYTADLQHALQLGQPGGGGGGNNDLDALGAILGGLPMPPIPGEGTPGGGAPPQGYPGGGGGKYNPEDYYY